MLFSALPLLSCLQKQMQARLQAQEDEFLKARRKKMSVNDFETLTIIGRGAFGEVRVCRKKDDKKIYAMKIMKKSEMLKKNQACYTQTQTHHSLIFLLVSITSSMLRASSRKKSGRRHTIPTLILVTISSSPC